MQAEQAEHVKPAKKNTVKLTKHCEIKQYQQSKQNHQRKQSKQHTQSKQST